MTFVTFVIIVINFLRIYLANHRARAPISVHISRSRLRTNRIYARNLGDHAGDLSEFLGRIIIQLFLIQNCVTFGANITGLHQSLHDGLGF